MSKPTLTRASFVAAVVVAWVGVAWSFTGSLLLATAVLAAGQLFASGGAGAYARAALFLLFGWALTAYQETGDPRVERWFHPDIPLAVGAVACALALVRRKSRRYVVRLALLVTVVGLAFSALDQEGVSVYWRARILAAKISGGLPHVGWRAVAAEAFGSRVSYRQVRTAGWIEVIDRKSGPYGDLELYRTKLGDFWASDANRKSVALIALEMSELDDYQIDAARIQPGDTVIDCGAHVGFYSKLALSRGADLVVAVEPDPENYWCFRENLKSEIDEGRVRLVQAGVWDERDSLTFYHSDSNPGAHGFFERDSEATTYQDVPVLPIDDLVAELGLQRVDWIKMDIEGSEARALLGAAEVLRKHKPKLAICTYHRHDDSEVIPPIVLNANARYEIAAKRIAADGAVRPKVLFFH